MSTVQRSSDEDEDEKVVIEDDEEEEEEEEEGPNKKEEEKAVHHQQHNHHQVPKIEIKPADFYFGTTLGEGAFARVVHAKSKKTGTEFAIKIMEKSHIKRENKVKHVMMERKVLTMISHPLVVKFHFSFQDPDYLFMVMDLIPGGILLDLIRLKAEEKLEKNIQNQACNIEMTRFYTSEMIQALEYLHHKGIIHRDLKPENVLIDRVGHIKLADFGTSALISDNQSPRTSFVGTQDYVSPEVLSGERKATRASDLWAVGVMIYQMLTGISPFRGATEFLTFEAIMGHIRKTNPLSFPSSIPKFAKDLIENLLKSNELDRIGGNEDETLDNGYPKLKSHEFFDGILWDELIHQLPPYQPDSKNFPDPNNMRDGAEDDWYLEGEATPIAHYIPQEELTKHSNGDNNPANRIWNRFLLEGENVVFTSVIYKRKGLFSKKRQLILTDKARLVYVDPDTMELKGEIPWTRTLPVQPYVKNSKEFEVKCNVTQRVYHLSDSDVGAQMWVDCINSVLEKQRSISSMSVSPVPSSWTTRDS